MNTFRLSQWGRARALLLLVPVLIGAAWLLRVAMAALPLDQGPGGPILVVTSGASNYGKYYAEILRNEGLNQFAVADISTVTPATLAAYDVVVLSKITLSGDQVTTLSNWVSGGGNLIAMGPDAQLANLLGLTSVGTTLSDGYVLVDPSSQAGNGIVNQTIQFHGTADRYTLNGASSIATLYSDAASATANPAVTLRSAGAGQAAAFTYDLATSIVYTRQGNPAWATQERDGFTPIRPDDKFYGNAAGDPRADWINLNKVAIPQADEQQRLLANLIITMNASRKPLPRFWYFPNGKKAVVIMTGDDHANGGTAGRFDQFLAASPAGCSVANWECVRGTSYIYTPTPLTNAQAATYTAQGFEVGLHITTDCNDFTAASLEATYVQQIADWVAKYSSIPAPITQRHHCIVWSDWVTAAKTQLNHGMRLDVSYYFWPPSWVNNTPGLFTGSAMPMRLADLNGALIDVYEATSQMTDESGQQYPFTIDTLLDRAVGAEGYYGAYTINAHTDLPDSFDARAVVASAQARGVPIVSSVQMLNWLDGRNASSFGSLAWDGSRLNFSIAAGTNATVLQAMLPKRSGAALLAGITRDGNGVSFNVSTIKGIEYAFFQATAGAYVATYAIDATAPTVTATSPTNGATDVEVGTTVTATFSEAMDPATINTNTFELRGPGNVLVPATVAYSSAPAPSAVLTPTAQLAASTTYTAIVKGGAADPRVKDVAGNALAVNFSWSFTTAAPPSCPCTAWNASTTPSNAAWPDSASNNLGVKFRAGMNGFVTGIRFYKGATNTGTHIGNLWTSAGQLLATATFVNESPSGWQQVDFATPVAITANTVYVASYFAPNGNYAADGSYFANGGVDNGPLHLLADSVAGGNGVYTYSSASTFPNSSFNATNYWVDVVFITGGGADTTPPTVTGVTPANGAMGVATTTSVTATFSEAMTAATVNTNTFQLRNSGGTLITAAVAYNATTRVATLTPSSALAGSTTYTATVVGGTNGVKDLAGNALASNQTWSFTTAEVDTTPPTVTAITPASGATGVSTTTTVTATFSEAMNAATINTNTFQLRNSGGTLVTAGVAYNATTRVATLTPSSTLAGGPTTYTATVVGGTNGVKDVAGNALASNQAWSFTTLDATAPTVTAISPASGATGVSTTTTITATFSEAMDPATITTSTFQLRNSGGTLVTATVAYDATTRVATLTPSSALAAGPTTYTATVVGGTNGVKDVAGNALGSSRTWSFTTVDMTAPTVTSTSPADGATGVSRNGNVTATFSESMNASTITTSTFLLRDPSGATVAATVTYASNSKTATLKPTQSFAANTGYTATISGGTTGVKDTAGNPMGSNFVWSFTTR